MGSFDRSKKRIQLWKKAILHFSLCFVMGFFTGFAPTSTASLFSGKAAILYRPIKNLGISAEPLEALNKTVELGSLNRSLMTEIPSSESKDLQSTATQVEDESESETIIPDKLLIVITTTRSGDQYQAAFLRRLAHTLRLVPSPLLWIVVEAQSDAPMTAGMLRKTGIMYRHLTFKENFTDPESEADYQRNVALNHIEYHRLDGIVHFADVSSIYDLGFFDEIREIEVFGTWPVVKVSTNRKRVIVEGPICRASKVVGWQVKDLNNVTGDGTAVRRPSRINISGFAFNSSILWDPERWGRPSSVPDTSQDSIKFVEQVVVEDESKLKGIPPHCSQIMLWHLHIPRTLPPTSSQYQNRR